jgi:hypothetical protein
MDDKDSSNSNFDSSEEELQGRYLNLSSKGKSGKKI